MSYTKVCNITKKYLNNQGYNDVSFDNGYYLLIFEHVKLFFYPGDDFLRISAIPTDRKYKIYRDMTVGVEGIGDMFIKYQPQKTNSELILVYEEEFLTDANINKAAVYIINRVQDIFSKMERLN